MGGRALRSLRLALALALAAPSSSSFAQTVSASAAGGVAPIQVGAAGATAAAVPAAGLALPSAPILPGTALPALPTVAPSPIAHGAAAPAVAAPASRSAARAASPAARAPASAAAAPAGALESAAGAAETLPAAAASEDARAGSAASSAVFDGGARGPRAEAPLNVLMLASESVPFAKTGGLADVTDALSRGLARQGQRVALMLPRYQQIDLAGREVERVPGTFQVPMGEGRSESARLLRVRHGGVDVYLIENDAFFGRPGLYSYGDQDFADNDDRFVFFSRAALEAARHIGFAPDVVHAHDWQAALAPALLKTVYKDDPFFARAASVLSVHNLAYQGVFKAEALAKAGISWKEFTPERFEYYGSFSLLKAGLVSADRILTVSRRYVEETLTKEFGMGLDGVLKGRLDDYSGIVNGVDLEEYDPGRDPLIAAHYGPRDVERGKALNKAALQAKLGLDADPGAPLAVVVSRIAGQKGLDLVAEALPKLVAMGWQLVLSGSAHPADKEGLAVEERFKEAARLHPGRVVFHPFDLDLPHLAFAAADFLLIPSRFEPCGLTQQYAMLYGALPIASAVGGLVDTVRDATDHPSDGTGYLMRTISAAGLLEAALRAEADRSDPARRGLLRRNAMRRDASWDSAILEYVRVYWNAVKTVLKGRS